MVEVVFTKNSGSYRVGQKRDFKPALAALFVSKLRVAEFFENSQSELPDDFSDIGLLPTVATKEAVADAKAETKKKRGRPAKQVYQTRDLKALG